MAWSALVLDAFLGLFIGVAAVNVPLDPCAKIAGKRWVSPAEARACLQWHPLVPEIKHNTIDAVNKTLAFHTSTNYQIKAPKPFADQVQEDLVADLGRISETSYSSEFDFHLDMYLSAKRLNDGHCGTYNYCYDSFYVTYLPTPLVLLTHSDGSQRIHIAPEAFALASQEFGDEIEIWQNVLPGKLKGHLEMLSGAEVLLINGENPWRAVNRNAMITGGYQSFSTRQNSFFSSYTRGSTGWTYNMGNFAQLAHPLVDSVTLTLQLVNETGRVDVRLPYRSRFGSASKNFTDAESYRSNNCVATNITNGIDLYAGKRVPSLDFFAAGTYFQQQPAISILEARRHPMNVILDGTALSDIDLPETLQPGLAPLNESYSVAEFFMLNDSITGVLALGSFSAKNFSMFQESLLNGLQALKLQGATQLIVDVTNNGGGYICIAHWLHRIIIGPKRSTEPQAGLDTEIRAGPLAQLIAKRVATGGDPDNLLYYNALQWRNASHQEFPPHADLLDPPVHLTINGRPDAFSPRLGQECQPFDIAPPDEALFEASRVAIVSNGRCASSCSLFSITMAKEEGVKTVVVGGAADRQQQYCGVVGGQSTDFSTIDTEIKSTGLKSHILAPPDFVTNSVQGITWRLGFGIDNRDEPEEWQDHPADHNMPLTVNNINRPVAIWEDVVKLLLTPSSIAPPVLAPAFVGQHGYQIRLKLKP
ncbi:hypothetical protein FISHEDRAFT_32250 [Fistulina hepatica ATCC 64428]|uniref:Uncharacterized protein n=1 Tax=Fistulina hepatica ATCC 64428 TaxID=1128425 RepID=A0A0D7AQW0_9AGAR|nr:hypothetical protein FISHEDRAFT_32250 [Fistulina hepatica ATCC 64428]